MDTLYIVIPAYNEEANIRQVIQDWYPVVEAHSGNGRSRLVIIDDGSKDGTYKMMQDYAKEWPLLLPLTKPNGGHGATVLYGYHYAISHGADYVFQTDSDGQTLSSEFEQFWRQRKQYDMVIGWRKNREDGLSRVFTTKVLKYVVRLCFGVSVPDANTPYRLMEAKKLEENLRPVPADFNLTNVVLSVIYTKRGHRVKYIPITFRPRQGGVNSINIKKIFKIGKKALTDFYKLNKTI